MKIWLQRITIKENREIEYNETLCDRVNDETIEIWNSEWLNTEMETLIKSAKLINEEEINKINLIIESEEFQLFEYQ
jgi:RNA-directed DNA polymerase